MQATLLRVFERFGASIGELSLDGEQVCWMLCEAWRDNQRSISCIPDGEYRCEIVDSPKFGAVYEIKGVPNRSHILMHAGNTTLHTEGCELYGTEIMLSGESVRTVESRKARDKFMALTGGKPFTLKVVTAFKR